MLFYYPEPSYSLQELKKINFIIPYILANGSRSLMKEGKENKNNALIQWAQRNYGVEGL